MSGSDVAEAAEKLETAIYACIARSKGVALDDVHLVLNLLAGKLRARSDKLREGSVADDGVSDEDLLDEREDEDTDGE